MSNCEKVELDDETGVVLDEGWVGIEGSMLHFRPSRGSGGFAVYGTEAQAKRQTGCDRAVRVVLKLEVQDGQEEKSGSR
jgi:hypothetical protein